MKCGDACAQGKQTDWGGTNTTYYKVLLIYHLPGRTEHYKYQSWYLFNPSSFKPGIPWMQSGDLLLGECAGFLSILRESLVTIAWCVFILWVGKMASWSWVMDRLQWMVLSLGDLVWNWQILFSGTNSHSILLFHCSKYWYFVIVYNVGLPDYIFVMGTKIKKFSPVHKM